MPLFLNLITWAISFGAPIMEEILWTEALVYPPINWVIFLLLELLALQIFLFKMHLLFFKAALQVHNKMFLF